MGVSYYGVDLHKRSTLLPGKYHSDSILAMIFQKQRGNILFLILLAVVLFAALAYAVTSSMRGGGKDGGDEKAEAQASELFNYFSQLDATVQRMMLTGGIKDYELNFYQDSADKYVYGSLDNTNCTEARCRVFDPAGGGMIGRTFLSMIRAPNGNNHVPRLMYVSVLGAGTDLPDIAITLQGIKTNLCRAINKKIGLSDILFSSGVPAASTTIMYQFAIPVGSFPTSTSPSSNIPFWVGNAGTFCTCTLTTAGACEGAYSPQLTHVILAR